MGITHGKNKANSLKEDESMNLQESFSS